MCCDDLAVRACGNAVCYARALTALERLRVSPPHLALGRRARRSNIAYGGLSESDRGNTARRVSPVFWLSVWADVHRYLFQSRARFRAGARHARRIPESARVNGIQGTVPVQVQVDNVGSVSDAKAIGGPKELRQAAVQSASALHFRSRCGGRNRTGRCRFPTEHSRAVALRLQWLWRNRARDRDGGIGVNPFSYGCRRGKRSGKEAGASEKVGATISGLGVPEPAHADGGECAGRDRRRNLREDGYRIPRRGAGAAQQLLDGYEEYFGDSLRPAALRQTSGVRRGRTPHYRSICFSLTSLKPRRITIRGSGAEEGTAGRS